MAQAKAGLLALALLVGWGAPAAADWLVTRDGARVESKGTWTVKGNQVLFRQPNGTLSALRLSEVDLDASALATAQAKEAALQPPPTPAPHRESILRLTEKDLPPVDSEEKAAAGTDGKPQEKKAAEALMVSSWDRVDLPNAAGVEIFGTVTNQGTVLVTAGTVAVSLYDEEGGILVTEAAELSNPAVAPGGSATFRIQFPGLVSFATAKFAVASQGYRIPESAPQAGESSEPTGEEPPATPEDGGQT